MSLTIVGLGNPGAEYDNTRHNAGRILLSMIAKRAKLEWKSDMKLNALTTTAEIDSTRQKSGRPLGGQAKIKFVLPETFMNNSGNAVAPLIKSQKDLDKLVVIYDDLDLGFGTMKISYNRGSGGHNGLASVAKRVKSEKFWRIRVGIAPVTPSGKIKKLPESQKGTVYLMKAFSPKEQDELKKMSKKIEQSLAVFAARGGAQAMNEFN